MNDTSYDYKNARLLLIGSSISIMLAGFTALAISTAMPDIASALHGKHMYPVAFGIPLVGQLIATPIAGAITDARGAKKPLIIGFILFLLGLIVCGLAPEINLFILGRALQGFAGGFLMVPVYALVGLFVPPIKRAFFFACFALSWVIPAIFGPVLAGKIVEAGHWRWIFLGVIPLVIAAASVIIPVLFNLPKYNKIINTKDKHVILTATTTGIAIGLIMIFSILPPVLYYLKIIGIIFSLSVCIYCAPKLFPKGTFTLKKGIPAVIATRGLSNALFVALESFIPLILQIGRGYSPSQSGIVLTIGTLSYACGSLVQGKIENPKLAMRIPQFGAILAFVGTCMTITSIFTFVHIYVSVLGWLITGFAVGLIYPAMSVIILSIVPQEKHGEASSKLQLADTLGSSTALATVTTLFSVMFIFPKPWPYIPVITLGLIIAILAVLSSTRLYTNDLQANLSDKFLKYRSNYEYENI